MKIAYVHSFYSSSQPSGENNAVNDQIAALRGAGHNVELISRTTPAEPQSMTYKLRSAVAATGLVGADPSDELARFAPDIVHVHNLFPNFGTRWIEAWGARTVATLHNFRTVCAAATLWRNGHDCVDCLRRGSLEAVRNKCYRNSMAATVPLAIATRNRGHHSRVLSDSAAIVTLNNGSEKLYRNLLDDKVTCIPNFSSDPGMMHLKRSGYLFAGRLTPEKGILDLAKNWRAPHALQIIGSGPQEAEIRRVAAANPNITYHGAAPRDDLLLAMRQVRALIIPSLWSEGIPTVALESLSVGTPIVVSDRVAARAMLMSSKSGAEFDVEQPLTLDAALEQQGVVGPDSARNARTIYEQLFAPSVWLGAIEKLYAAVLRGNTAN
ncbi:glycosyltransferase family 4 protein [Rhodococcus kroppenstedtii]|uniref:glycosyltransferase family 4 protein n=1 Tax=Rhodococcoides kroppenstedtii TaxID=293050 RepID=UPI001C9A928A|nr:glycosyltransferase family 4 protein [Rhodococcus kroppenstedtii]MBY6437538.1 glycosyltransferase family 4 protein [Rhodococcus kroppenstedtii]